MRERETPRFSPPALGGASLLVIFAVLTLTIFALLSLSTVRADVRLADSAAQAVTDWYAADCKAQEILARLRNGEEPEGVEFWGSGLLYAGYAVPISDTQELQVEVILKGVEGGPLVLRWQAAPTGEWTGGENYTVWDGEWEENSYD